MPGRRCLCGLDQFIVHMKQEKGVRGVATSGCLAFCAGFIGALGLAVCYKVLQVVK